MSLSTTMKNDYNVTYNDLITTTHQAYMRNLESSPLLYICLYGLLLGWDL